MRTIRGAVLLALAVALMAAIGIAITRMTPSAGRAASHTQGPLVSTRWLAAHIDDPELVILHVAADSSTYVDGHIPGARFLPVYRIVVQRDGLPNELPAVVDLVTAFESLGVSNHSRVILYGDMHGLWAARGLFTLDYLGLGSRAALLDGGLEVWRAEGRNIDAAVPTVTTGTLTVSLQPSLVVDALWVSEHGGHPTVDLVDARPEAQYRGDEPGTGIERPGHIPGALSFFWEEALESPERPVLKDLQTLRRMYRQRGIGAGDTVVTYCRTGVQASHAYFVARLLDMPVRLYDGSYMDWSNRTTFPVERPQ